MQIRSGVKCAITTALGMMVFLTASGAEANGRFPRGEHIIEYPSDPNHLLLAATYGLVTTTDGGKNWYYVCETAFSLYPPPMGSDLGYMGDPIVALTADDSLLAGVQVRVNKSSDNACGWAKVLEETGKAVDDISVAPSNKNIAVALVRSPTTNTTQVYESTNGGTTWAAIGMPLSMIMIGYTIDIDPKDPMHLMVTGVTSLLPDVESGVFLNSTNHGMTWTSSKIPKTNAFQPPYIAAVLPTDGKTVFVRTDEWVDNSSGATNARDALLVTKDGGMTWTELLRPTGMDGNGAKLYGFALSPDGSTVLAGFGDPVEGGGRNVDRDVMGVYKSTGADWSFGANPTPIFMESATCITWTAKGIYVCGSPDGMTSYIGFATDVSKVNAAGLTKIMEVNKLKGEPPCCAGRASTACDWNVECVRFGACVDGGMSLPDAGVCMMPDAGREGGAGAGGSAGSGGVGGAGTGGATGGTGGATTGGTGGATTGGTGGATTGGAGTGGATTGGTGGSGGGGDDGCKCRMAATSRDRSATGLSLLLGLVGASGWRRSRRRSKSAA